MQEFAVIFDFNGTMLFDTQIQYHAWNKLVQETLGHGIAQEEFLHCLNGRTSHATVEYIWGNTLNEEQKRALIDRKRQNYKEYCLSHPNEFKLADGIPEILDYMQEQNIPYTIATSSNPRSVDFYFEHLHLGKWFHRDQIVCSDKHFPGKPAPDIYVYSAEQLGIAPEHCFVIEDALAGVQSARAAGIGHIVFIDSSQDHQVRANAAADLVIEDFSVLFDLIKKTNQQKKEMRSMEKVYQFLKEAQTYYLATMDGDQPRVRPFGTIHLFEGKLYIQTGKVKDVSKQLAVNGKVELCAMKGGDWLRVAGTLVEDDRLEARESMLNAYPSLKAMYAADDGNTQVLYFKDATATFSSFTKAPETVTF